jgi:hypothetical protein
VKYTIIGILAISALLLVWIYRTGTTQDFLIMLVAIVSVTFFSSIDSLWNYLYPNSPRAQKARAKGDAIVVKLPGKGDEGK